MSFLRIETQRTSNFPAELVFDPEWYAQTYELGRDRGEDYLLDHYLSRGQSSGYNPSPYFMTGFVRKQLHHLDLARDADLRQTFMNHCDLIDPHILLPRKPVGYGADRPLPSDVAADWFNLSAYILRILDSRSIRHSLFFDPDFIRDPDGNPVDSPLNYYLRNQSFTDVQTSVLFDPTYYEAIYPEVAHALTRDGRRSYQSLLHHFLETGMSEGMKPFPDFDAEFYRERYPELAVELAKSSTTEIEHFLLQGLREGRDPNPYFNTGYYVEHNPDVIEAMRRGNLCGPFEHFLKIGSVAKYRANPPLYRVTVPDRYGKALYEKRCNVTVANLMSTGETIAFPDPGETPALSCIIPVVNQGNMTLHLLWQLASIAWRRDMPAIEVIVVDNGSTDITCDLADLTENLRIVRSETPLGYPKACNLGAAEARGPVLLMMNNDIEFGADAIKRGLARIQNGAGIGAVGGRVLLMNGELQEAGSYLTDDGSSMGFGRHSDPTLPRNNVPREVDYCSGCFLFLRTADFRQVGGFDEVFSPGYYEEADLCMRLRARGLVSVLDPTIYVYHYEYASYSKGRPFSVSRAQIRRNRSIFFSRHRQALARLPQIQSHDWQKRLFDARTGTIRTIAVVEDRIPDRSMGSGFVRSADLIDSLRNAGHQVTLFAMHCEAGDNAESLSQRGIEVVECYSSDASANPLYGREWDFDLVWICRTHNIPLWGQIVRQAKRYNPSIKMVFDTEAIATLRDANRREVRNLPLRDDVNHLVGLELGQAEALYPDAIVVVNPIDRSAVEGLGIAPTFQLGHRIVGAGRLAGLADRAGLFFCGSFHEIDSPNFDSMEWFLSDVWPLLRAHMPNLGFTIAGHCANNVPLEKLVESNAGVRYLGRLDSVGPAMDAARVFIAPTRYAGGVPHKVHEAMSLGVPVVCTDLLRNQVSNEDFPPERVPVLSADPRDPQAFANACLSLLQDDRLWQKLQSEAVDFVAATASDKNFDCNIRKIIDALF
jgi:GT2 family glycosyltransferase